jgi:hypothetical protein
MSRSHESRPSGSQNRIEQVRRSWSENETQRRRNRALVLQMALVSAIFPEKTKRQKVGTCMSY